MDIVQDFCEHYTFKAVASMRKLTEPLRTHYGIDNFYHYHIESDGSWYCAADNLEVGHQYFGSNLHKNDPFYVHPTLLPQLNVLTEMVSAESFRAYENVYRRALAVVCRYIIIRKPAPGICDIFGFTTGQKENSLRETAIQTPHALDAFVTYWYEKSAKLRIRLYENRILLPEFRGPSFRQKTDFHDRLQLLEETNGRFLTETASQNPALLTLLTAREKECIFWYLQGLTAYETGRKLFISKRTVEAHFDHIKQKLNLNHKRTLFQKIDPLSLALDLRK